MSWPWWLRWWSRRRPANGATEKRLELEAKLRKAERETGAVERLADRVAELPPDEFARRIQQAFDLHRRRA